MKCNYFVFRLIILNLIFASSAIGQIVHNASPVEYQKIQEPDKLQSFFYNFEQRINAHDFKLGWYYFDSLTVFGDDVLSWDGLDAKIYNYLSYANQSDSSLVATYQSKPVGFAPLFSVLEAAPVRPIQNIVVGDTFTCRVTIATATTDNAVNATVVIAKTIDNDLLPVNSFRIIEISPEFFQAIAKYGENYFVGYAGVCGSIPPEMKSASWYEQWDFVLDDPKICSRKLKPSTLKIINGAFVQTEITLSRDGLSQSFRELTMNDAMNELDCALIAHIGDISVSGGQTSDDAFMLICDDGFNRILTAGLNGMLTSMPGHNSGGSWGYSFGNLALMSFNRASRQLLTFDEQSNDYQLFDYTPSMQGAFDLSTSIYQPASGKNQYLARGLTSAFSNPPYGTRYESSLWLSESDVYATDPRLNVYSTYGGTHLMKEYWGLNTSCGYEEFALPPKYTLDDWFVCRSAMNNWSYQYFDVFLISDGKYIAAVNAEDTFFDNQSSSVLHPLWTYEFEPRRFFVPELERTADGIFYACDPTLNMIHVFEPKDGRYLYSTTPTEFLDDRGPMKDIAAMKQISSQGGGLLFFYEDLFISRSWREETGISRFLPTGKVDLLGIDDVGNSYMQVKFISTGRTRLNLVLLDSARNEIQVRGPLYVNAGVNKVYISNPNALDIGIKYLPASNANYGIHSFAEEILEIPISGTPKYSHIDTPIAMGTPLHLGVRPTVTDSRFFIDISSNDDRYVSVEVYDIRGRQVSRMPEVFIPKGTTTLTRSFLKTATNGLYFLVVTDGVTAATAKIIKY
jgi:hypothetical protein